MPTDEERATLKSQIIKSAIWLFSTRYFAQAFTWVSTIIVARLLSPEDYGLMGMAMIYIGFVDFITEFGFGSAIIQKENLSEDEISSSFWYMILISVGMFAITFFSAGIIASFFDNHKLQNIIKVLAFGFIIGGIKTVPFNLATKELEFVKRSKAELSSDLISTTTILICAFSGFGVWSLVTGSLVRGIILTVLILAMFKWSPRFVFKFDKIYRILKFGLTVTASRVTWYFYSQADFAIIGKVFGDVSLGYYAMAKTIAAVPIEKITTILNQIMFPAFSKMLSDRKLMGDYFLKATRIVATLTFPIFAGLIFIADDAVILILTSKWEPISPILKIFCLAGIINSIAVLCSPLLLSLNKANIELKFNLIRAVVMSMAFIVGSFYGMQGVAFSWISIYPILCIVFIKMTLNEIEVGAACYLKEIRYPLVKVGIMILALTALNIILFADFCLINRVVCEVSIGFFIYISLTFFFEKKEVLKFREIFSN